MTFSPPIKKTIVASSNITPPLRRRACILYSPEEKRVIRENFETTYALLSLDLHNSYMEQSLLDICVNYPEDIPLSPITKKLLLNDILEIMTEPETPPSVLKYCIDYLNRRKVW